MSSTNRGAQRLEDVREGIHRVVRILLTRAQRRALADVRNTCGRPYATVIALNTRTRVLEELIRLRLVEKPPHFMAKWALTPLGVDVLERP